MLMTSGIVFGLTSCTNDNKKYETVEESDVIQTFEFSEQDIKEGQKIADECSFYVTRFNNEVLPVLYAARNDNLEVVLKFNSNTVDDLSHIIQSAKEKYNSNWFTLPVKDDIKLSMEIKEKTKSDFHLDLATVANIRFAGFINYQNTISNPNQIEPKVINEYKNVNFVFPSNEKPHWFFKNYEIDKVYYPIIETNIPLYCADSIQYAISQFPLNYDSIVTTQFHNSGSLSAKESLFIAEEIKDGEM